MTWLSDLSSVTESLSAERKRGQVGCARALLAGLRAVGSPWTLTGCGHEQLQRDPGDNAGLMALSLFLILSWGLIFFFSSQLSFSTPRREMDGLSLLHFITSICCSLFQNEKEHSTPDYFFASKFLILRKLRAGKVVHSVLSAMRGCCSPATRQV